jgi:hypothetical protein
MSIQLICLIVVIAVLASRVLDLIRTQKASGNTSATPRRNEVDMPDKAVITAWEDDSDIIAIDDENDA